MTTTPQHRHPPRRGDADVLRQIRAARFADRRVCPRCEGCHVSLWGTFCGRQRYRCRSCRRTFSDLTATPFAYTKKLALWPGFLDLFHHAASVRRCAAVLRVHSSTAFRWRHAVLDHTRRAPARLLTGTVELTELTFAVSYKGSRRLNGDGRRRSARELGALPIGFPRTCVVLLWCREGGVASGNLNEHLATLRGVAAFLRARVATGTTVICRYRRPSMYGLGIRHAGCILETTPPHQNPCPCLLNVDSYAGRFRQWLLRFRGVATKYLDNYLSWHRIIYSGQTQQRRTAAYVRMLVGGSP